MTHASDADSHSQLAPSSQSLQARALATLPVLSNIILDKNETLKLALACLLADGHLLLQDLPGMGKTTLAHALAQVLGLGFNRVQFTSDMLPADLLGMVLYHEGEFSFRKGVIFSELLLADEINRASPKTQSALLEAMEERQVSIDGTTYALPQPFFVIATQNPKGEAGVYPLPQSQLDRFLMCLSLGFPSRAAMLELLTGKSRREMLAKLPQMLNKSAILAIKREIKTVFAAPVVLDYILDASEKARATANNSLSPRAVLGLLTAAKSYAYLSGQDNVAIDDVQAVWAATTKHRLGDNVILAGGLAGGL